jgi:hypothetical protein
MKYLFLLYGPDRPLPEPGSAEHREWFERWAAATGAMRAAGVLVDCAPVQPPEFSTTLHAENGEVLLTDGPAAEIKEHFGGFTLVDCSDLDEAVKWAQTLPTATEGSIEIRPVVQVTPPG